MRTAPDPDPLARFSPATRAWFTGSFLGPTEAQAGAWTAIGAGRHTLVVAPTGSGKTLAAFLHALDQLATEERPTDRDLRCRVLYVSPLKALGVDVERNLRAPLVGIGRAATELGLAPPQLRVAIRSGDTPAAERRAFATNPPDALITTPESLFLLLTSAARDRLRGVRTVILDEVHAVAGSKRGAHLALSLERLDALLPGPAQRIGLSATVRPLDEVAAFLGGPHPVEVVAPPAAKRFDLRVEVPVPDLTELGQPTGDLTGPTAAAAPRASIWPHVEERILDLVEANRSTIVFANSRRLAERLCNRLNELAHQRIHGQQSASLPADSGPAELMAASGTARGAEPTVARAHHGSVSRQQRAQIEEDLKAGRLRCVVATSSLELGIDMGAVDLVVQVESPPSVASGLQRIGRAGHQVGAVSAGVVLPKHRGDLLTAAVVTAAMLAGRIEALRCPRNPLDVLAQQVVAAVSLEDWEVDQLFELVRRAAPFAQLTRAVFEAVLDMLAGRYPSEDFAELRPRLVWDRVRGTLTARPGAQRLAVTAGGTIPDRGLFGVFMVSPGETGPAGPTGPAGRGSRVGELDEEMVYESRAGDVFTLGSSSWRIERITHDRVLVSPATGQPGRLPYWKGDAAGRPAELGRAVGAFVRELGGLAPDQARQRATRTGLDAFAADNLVAYLAEQRAATGYLPDDRTVVVERFRDELGDWRIAIHSPYGSAVHAPWALAIAARLRERYGASSPPQLMTADDGILLRLPDTAVQPPPDLALFDPEEIEPLVTAELGSSALFAARFRECAARALLLPRRAGARSPLWQQRQRSAHLLSVASRYDRFPIVLETVRECLHDVFDVTALVGLVTDLRDGRVRMVEVTTERPSPFARSLLFGYVAAFMYEGDAPLAERRSAALTLDPELLAELLGRTELRELLDAGVAAELEAAAQRLTDQRQAGSVEEAADVLRELGPLTADQAALRGVRAGWLTELGQTGRAIRVRIGSVERWAAVEDAGRLRDALGVPLPPGLPTAFTEPVPDPLGDLVRRYARGHGPFPAAAVADWLGIGTAVATAALRALARDGQVVEGEFSQGAPATEWCDPRVLRTLRRRSLAVLRDQIEPVDPRRLAHFLPGWQQVGGGSRGVEGVLRAVEQLQGAALPAAALERLVLPARVADYSPAMLDELCAAGEVVWAGRGEGRIALYLADQCQLLLPEPDPGLELTERHTALLSALADNALFARALTERTGLDLTDPAELTGLVWDLVWAGHLTNDTLAPLRGQLDRGSRPRTALVPAAGTRRRYARPVRPGPAQLAGRWSLLPPRATDPTRRAHALAEILLDRYAVLTRGAVTAEEVPGGFAGVYRVLSALEENGQVRRGYFVAGLGAAQFAVAGAVDALRAEGTGSAPTPLVLAATDPANPYGAALEWPTRTARGGQRPARRLGALVVLAAGELVFYLERGGRSALSWTSDPQQLRAAGLALAEAVRAGRIDPLALQRVNGESALDWSGAQVLAAAGFAVTPGGLRLRR